MRADICRPAVNQSTHFEFMTKSKEQARLAHVDRQGGPLRVYIQLLGTRARSVQQAHNHQTEDSAHHSPQTEFPARSRLSSQTRNICSFTHGSNRMPIPPGSALADRTARRSGAPF